MYNKIRFILLDSSSSSSSSSTSKSLDAIAGQVEAQFEIASKSIIDLIMNIFNFAIIPIAGMGVLSVIFFLIFSIAKSKRKRDGEDLEEKLRDLIIAVIIFVLIAGYASYAWGLVKYIIA